MMKERVMTMRFRKRTDRGIVILPGIGRVTDSQILVGDQFRKFCPDLLEEIPDEPALAVPAPVAKPLPPPPPAPVPPPPVVEPEPVKPMQIISDEPEVTSEDIPPSRPSETGKDSADKLEKRATARRKR
jgi:hypothetical protein